jgi:hypothetical protein
MASRHSYVQFYPSDWLAGMGFMPPLLEWLYLQVCLYNWDKVEPVPETEHAMRFSRHADWAADLERLIDSGRVIRTRGGGLFVERAMAEARKSYELWEKKSRGGRGGKNAENHDDEKHSLKSDGNTLGNTMADEQQVTRTKARARVLPNGNTPQTPKGENAPVGDFIFSVPPDAWAEWVDHRKAIKKPMSDGTAKRILRELEKFHQERGHDPTAVLHQSIDNGWTGVFELKGKGRGRADQSRGGFQSAIDEARG